MSPASSNAIAPGGAVVVDVLAGREQLDAVGERRAGPAAGGDRRSSWPIGAGSVEPAAIAARASVITQSYICGAVGHLVLDAGTSQPGHQGPIAGRADDREPVGPRRVARERLLGEARHEQAVEPDDAGRPGSRRRRSRPPGSAPR